MNWFAPIAATLFLANCLADITVNIRNSVFTVPSGGVGSNSTDPSKVVIGADGSPLVGTQFVAQLFWGWTNTPEDQFVAAGQPAQFVSETSSAPGTWSGRNVTIRGVAPGQEILLQVRAWNISWAPTYEAAVFSSGETLPFRFSQPIDLQSPQDRWMTNFIGFRVPNPWRSGILTSFEFQIAENQDLQTRISDINDPYFGDVPNPLTGQPTPSVLLRNPRSPVFGNYAGLWPYLEFQPPPNQYGYAWLGYPYFSGATIPTLTNYFGYVPVTIRVTPSSLRSNPWLVVTSPAAGTQPRPVLRGLAGRKYRILSSADLKAWVPVGEVEGNHSEVDLGAIAESSAAAHFLRAIDVTPP